MERKKALFSNNYRNGMKFIVRSASSKCPRTAMFPALANPGRKRKTPSCGPLTDGTPPPTWAAWHAYWHDSNHVIAVPATARTQGQTKRLIFQRCSQVFVHALAMQNHVTAATKPARCLSPCASAIVSRHALQKQECTCPTMKRAILLSQVTCVLDRFSTS